jgi:hypothetical protein
LWQFAADHRSVRLSLPGLPVAGSAEPIRVNIDFETGVVDQIIEWLTMVRALQPANNQPAATLDRAPAGLCMCH